MAEAVRLRFESAHIERAIDQLGKRAQPVLLRVMKRTGTSARAVLARGIAGDMGLRVGTVRDELRISTGGGESPFVSIAASARRIPLEEFKASGPLPSRGRGVVSARIGGARKRYPGAFRARMRSGHIGVFQRGSQLVRKSPGAWAPNLPIFELKGPSLWHVGLKVAEASRARFAEQLVKNLEHEVGFALAQVG